MTTAVIAFTRRGTALGRSLADALGGTLHVPARFAPEHELVRKWLEGGAGNRTRNSPV